MYYKADDKSNLVMGDSESSNLAPRGTDEPMFLGKCYCKPFSNHFHNISSRTPDLPTNVNVGNVFGFDFKTKMVQSFMKESIEREVAHIIYGGKYGKSSYQGFHSRFYLAHYGYCSTAYLCELAQKLKENQCQSIYLDVDNGDNAQSPWGKFVIASQKILKQNKRGETQECCLEIIRNFFHQCVIQGGCKKGKVVILIDHIDRVFIDWLRAGNAMRKSVKGNIAVSKYKNLKWEKRKGEEAEICLQNITLYEVDLLRRTWYKALKQLGESGNGKIKYLFVATALTELEHAFGYYRHKDVENSVVRINTATEWRMSVPASRMVSEIGTIILELSESCEDNQCTTDCGSPSRCLFYENSSLTGNLSDRLPEFYETCEHNVWLFGASFRHTISDAEGESGCNYKEEPWDKNIKDYYKHENGNHKRDRSLLYDYLWSFCLYAAEALGEETDLVEQMQDDSFFKKIKKTIYKWKVIRLWKNVEKNWGKISEKFEKRTAGLLNELSQSKKGMTDKELCGYMKKSLPRAGKKLIDIQLKTSVNKDSENGYDSESCAARVLAGRNILFSGTEFTPRPFMEYLYGTKSVLYIPKNIFLGG